MVPSGTGVKINVNVEPMDGFTLANTEWRCSFKASQACIEVSKANATKVDDNNYICNVPTEIVGKGIIYGKIEMQIPDFGWLGGLRPEIAIFDTGVKVF